MVSSHSHRYAVFKGRAKVLATAGQSAQAQSDEPPTVCGRPLPQCAVALLSMPRRLVAKALACCCASRNVDAYGTVGNVGGSGDGMGMGMGTGEGVGAVQFRSEEASVMMSQTMGAAGDSAAGEMHFDGSVPSVTRVSSLQRTTNNVRADANASFSIGGHDSDDIPAGEEDDEGGGEVTLTFGGDAGNVTPPTADVDSLGDLDTPPTTPSRFGGGAFAMDEEEAQEDDGGLLL